MGVELFCNQITAYEMRISDWSSDVCSAVRLALHALHLPHDLSPVYGQARLLADEKAAVLALFERRINERIPACYRPGEAWFAGLSFKCIVGSRIGNECVSGCRSRR